MLRGSAKVTSSFCFEASKVVGLNMKTNFVSGFIRIAQLYSLKYLYFSLQQMSAMPVKEPIFIASRNRLKSNYFERFTCLVNVSKNNFSQKSMDLLAKSQMDPFTNFCGKAVVVLSGCTEGFSVFTTLGNGV